MIRKTASKASRETMLDKTIVGEENRAKKGASKKR